MWPLKGITLNELKESFDNRSGVFLDDLTLDKVHRLLEEEQSIEFVLIRFEY